MNDEVNFPQMVNNLCKPGKDIVDAMTPSTCHIMHMVIGLISELEELEGALEGKNLKHVIEEAGDVEFYLEGLFQGVRKLTGCNQIVTLTVEDSRSAVQHLSDGLKRLIIYKDTGKGMLGIRKGIKLTHDRLHGIYRLVNINRKDVIQANMDKLLRGQNARYSSGSYSDDQANSRADKQGQVDDV